MLVLEGTRFIILGNILNPSLVVSNLTFFYSGAYVFSNIIVNIDVSRLFGAVSIRLGIEVRQEKFDITEGQEESYVDGGAQSFPVSQPSKELSETRTNVVSYLTLDWDISDDFLIEGAAGYENYSDFGGNTSLKAGLSFK